MRLEIWRGGKSLTIGVFHWDDLLVVVQVVQQRREHAPAGIQLVVTNKVGVIALEGIQDQGLVGLGDLEVGEAAAVGQVQLGHHRLHGQTGQLRVHLNVDGLVGLDTDDQLVTRDILEDTRGDVLELDTDLGLLLVQGCQGVLVRCTYGAKAVQLTLAGLENERNAVPPLILNISDEGAEGWAARVLGNGVVLQVSRLTSVQRATVLANDDVLGLNRIHRTQNTDLLVTDVLRGEGDGALHGEQSQDLQKVYIIISMTPWSFGENTHGFA